MQFGIRDSGFGILLASVWTALIFVGCLWPGRELPNVPVAFIDKWVHFVLFGGFAFLWLTALGSRRLKALLVAASGGIALGWLVEVLQYLLPQLGRTYDVMDIAADGVGAVLGVGLYRLVFRRAFRGRL